MKSKLFAVLLAVAMMLVIVPAVAAQEGGQDYVVVADDWLSKLADKFLGDIFAYPAITNATNQKFAEDDSYAKIGDSDLIEIGWLKVHSYGLLLMVGYLVGTAWGAREARRRGMPPEWVIDYALWGLLSAIVFARVVFVVLDLDWFLRRPAAMLQVWNGGLAFQTFCRF